MGVSGFCNSFCIFAYFFFMLIGWTKITHRYMHIPIVNRRFYLGTWFIFPIRSIMLNTCAATVVLRWYLFVRKNINLASSLFLHDILLLPNWASLFFTSCRIPINGSRFSKFDRMKYTFLKFRRENPLKVRVALWYGFW